MWPKAAVLAKLAVAAALACARASLLLVDVPVARRDPVARRLATRPVPFAPTEALRATGAFLRRAAAARFLVA